MPSSHATRNILRSSESTSRPAHAVLQAPTTWPALCPLHYRLHRDATRVLDPCLHASGVRSPSPSLSLCPLYKRKQPPPPPALGEHEHALLGSARARSSPPPSRGPSSSHMTELPPSLSRSRQPVPTPGPLFPFRPRPSAAAATTTTTTTTLRDRTARSIDIARRMGAEGGRGEGWRGGREAQRGRPSP